MSPRSYCYEIWLEELLDNRWAVWFSDMEFIPPGKRKGPGTILRGKLPDQAALFGLLGRIRDLNLTLIQVKRMEEIPQHEEDRRE